MFVSLCLQEFAAAGEQFDMVFIDADKTSYLSYYTFLLDHNLLRLDGVLCVDNALFKGRVYLNDSVDPNGLMLRDFNQFVASDPRVEQVSGHGGVMGAVLRHMAIPNRFRKVGQFSKPLETQMCVQNS